MEKSGLIFEALQQKIQGHMSMQMMEEDIEKAEQYQNNIEASRKLVIAMSADYIALAMQSTAPLTSRGEKAQRRQKIGDIVRGTLELLDDDGEALFNAMDLFLSGQADDQTPSYDDEQRKNILSDRDFDLGECVDTLLGKEGNDAFKFVIDPIMKLVRSDDFLDKIKTHTISSPDGSYFTSAHRVLAEEIHTLFTSGKLADFDFQVRKSRKGNQSSPADKYFLRAL